jgi:hypothetical protein
MSKKPEIRFDPSFFETFEGTDEELQEIMTEITQMFENKTIEEIKAIGKPVDWDELDPEEAEKLARVINSHSNGSDKRYLQ